MSLFNAAVCAKAMDRMGHGLIKVFLFLCGWDEGICLINQVISACKHLEN